MIGLVFDVGVIVDAQRNPGSEADCALSAAVSKKCRLIVTSILIGEYEVKLMEGKPNHVSFHEISSFIDDIIAYADEVIAFRTMTKVKDSFDLAVVIDTAKTGDADIVVTDRPGLVSEYWSGECMSAMAFLEKLRT